MHYLLQVILSQQRYFSYAASPLSSGDWNYDCYLVWPLLKERVLQEPLGSLDEETNGIPRHASSTCSDLESATKVLILFCILVIIAGDWYLVWPLLMVWLSQEVLDSPVGETNGLDKGSEHPVIIASIVYDLLKSCRSSVVSFLLLGLREDGKN